LALVSAPAVPVPGAVEAPALDERKLNGGSAWLLAVCCVAQFMVILDLSIVNVALPRIQTDLGFSSPDLQWVVDAYAITFAGFLMLGGRAADHFGQRRTFAAALVLFGIASLIGGLAPNQGMLVGARALQGFAAALMAACSLAIITASFPPGPKLHRAIATWAAMNGLGGAAGTLFGGIITEFLSWRWVLLINPPIAIAAAVVGWAVVAERKRAKPGDSFDLAGALTLTIGQMVLVFGVVEGGLKGWTAFDALGPIILGAALLGLFGVIETRFASHPLIPFKELTKPLKMANNVVLLFSAALFPMWFVTSLYMQQVLGISPFHTGLNFLPMTLAILLIAPRAGKLVGRFGVRAVLGSGLTMMTVGLLLFTQIKSSGTPLVWVVIPGVLTTAGIAMSIVPSTIAATQGAKEGQAGLASGLVNTSRQVGGGLGLALLITLATQHSTDLIGHGSQVADALTHGFRLAYLIGAGLTALAALVTFVAVPRPDAAERVADRRLAAVVIVAIAGFVALAAIFHDTHGNPLGRYSTANTYSFASAPGLHPPKYRVIHSEPGAKLTPGYIFTANFFNLNEPPIEGQSGPLILDRELQPVWFQPVRKKLVASNLSAQTYEGKPVLSWWQGEVTNTGATESGEDVVVNQHYQTIARLHATGGWVVTLHEFLIDGQHAWVTANKNIPLDLSKYGGAYNGALIDSAVQEYDLKTGRLIRSWDALDHIPLSQVQATLPTNGFPWDAYHVNAIDLSPDGKNFLVSMRDTWAVYLVDIASGKIKWTLGGRDSDFKLGPGAAFAWQHDARLGPNSTVTMFDDHCCQLTGGGSYIEAKAASRALVLKLDQQAHTATLVSQFGQGFRLESEYMGDTQPQQGGNVFVGWGSEPYISEFSSSGKLLWEAQLPGPDLSYRATLGQWVGEPLTAPVGVARTVGGNATVDASWNGATKLASWKVLAEPGAAHPKVVASRAKSGFETAIPVAGSYKSFALQALDSNGRTIGTSRPFTLGS
jgi:EmrB/QacA subfamily drug resistance transporter